MTHKYSAHRSAPARTTRRRRRLTMEGLEARNLMAADTLGDLLRDEADAPPDSPVAAAVALGDFNLDSIVNSADYSLWRNSQGARETRFTGADGDGDGIVGPGDYAIWKQNFGMKVPAKSPTGQPVDLMGHMLEATNAADWGDTIHVQAQVRGGGELDPSSGSFQIGWYLSKDASGSSDDVALHLADTGETTFEHRPITGALKPLSQHALGPRFSVELQLPESAPDGFGGTRFYVVMKTDVGNDVAETSESNNFGQLGDFKDRDAIEITTASSLFESVDLFDAAGDSTRDVIFEDGALQFQFDSSLNTLGQRVRLEHIGRGSAVTLLDTYTAFGAGERVVNLDGLSYLLDGDNQFRVRLDVLPGIYGYSEVFTIDVRPTVSMNGTFAGETLSFETGIGDASLYFGQGGTDTLYLDVAPTDILDLNGVSLIEPKPIGIDPTIRLQSSPRQAIYQGTAFDFLTLGDGREIYFQGIERLEFSDGSVEQLSVLTNDTYFADQWNLHVTDVPGAWRFTQGRSRVLLVSLDSGIVATDSDLFHSPVENFASPILKSPPVTDLHRSRLRLDLTSWDVSQNPGHGQQANSVLASTPNNGYGVAGINWDSDVRVTNVYYHSAGGPSFQEAISDALDYAQENGLKVVFQGGVQGEYWLNAGGSQSELEDLLSEHEDVALFAIAAGNGNIDINNDDPNNPSVEDGLSGGVARLQTTHPNVIAVGALKATKTSVDGLQNATDVYRASYSNYGPALTLMAPTDSPAITYEGNRNTFTGTSAANPNMAAMASLVWSANPDLTGNEVREILIGTAMDIGLTGRDNETGNGLVNVDAAVRRALALARAPQVAGLYPNIPEIGVISQPVEKSIDNPFDIRIVLATSDAALTDPDDDAPAEAKVHGRTNLRHTLTDDLLATIAGGRASGRSTSDMTYSARDGVCWHADDETWSDSVDQAWIDIDNLSDWASSAASLALV